MFAHACVCWHMCVNFCDRFICMILLNLDVAQQNGVSNQHEATIDYEQCKLSMLYIVCACMCVSAHAKTCILRSNAETFNRLFK